MGVGLVMAAFAAAEETKLDHAPARLFVYMAASALDSDSTPGCWKGRDNMARALGNNGPAGHRAVARAIETLKIAGLVTVVQRSAPGGRTARYALCRRMGQPLRPLDIGGRSTSPVEETHDAQRLANAGRSAPNEGRSAVTTQDAQRRVEEKEDYKEEGEESRPESKCSRHSGFNDAPPCGRCKEARIRAEEWDARQKQRKVHVFRAGVHEHDQNARDALTRIKRERALPLSVDEMLADAYRIGNGEPWEGYRVINKITESSLDGATNPAAALRKRLADAA